MVAAVSFVLTLFMAAPTLATQGNNGTLKVHEAGTPSGTESNDPKVCEFNFEGFGFDVGQDGYIIVDGQGQTDADAALTLSFGPANADGYYETEYVNDGGALTLADGHYKATLYGKDTGQPSQPNLEDEKAKSKVFKVECGIAGDGDGDGDGDESCPSPTTLLVTFSWNGTSFTPNGGSAHGVNVTGDADMAFWTSSQIISALVISAGGVSYNIALDFPETVGSVSPHNYAVFGGASIDDLGFCVGEKTRPDTTTSGPSVELSKTAECATLDNGMATVTGTITAESDSQRPSRITTALDRILSGDATLHMEDIGDLIGVVLTSPGDSVTVNYAITFDPGDVESFENFVEVTIEDAETGEDRMKIYNARAAFELCDEGEEPGEDEQGELTVIKYECEAEAAGVAFFVNDPEAPIEDCDLSEGEFTLNPGGVALTVDGSESIDLDAGAAYTLTETSPNSGTSEPFAVVAEAETVVVVLNFFTEDEQGGTDPGDGETPREGTKGGQLPDTALSTPTWTFPALLALALLAGLGATALATAEARRRR